MRERGSPDEERRRLFRKMEVVYVYAPPVLAVLVAASGSAVLALFVPVPNTTFWSRWAIGILLTLVLPAIAYVAKSRLR